MGEKFNNPENTDNKESEVLGSSDPAAEKNGEQTVKGDTVQETEETVSDAGDAVQEAQEKVTQEVSEEGLTDEPSGDAPEAQEEVSSKDAAEDVSEETPGEISENVQDAGEPENADRVSEVTSDDAARDDSFSFEDDYKTADEDEIFSTDVKPESVEDVHAEETASEQVKPEDTFTSEEKPADTLISEEKPDHTPDNVQDKEDSTQNQSFFSKEDRTGTPKKKRSKKFLFWLIPAIAGGAAAAVIFGVGAQNKDKFWNDTYFGDMYVGGKTVDEVRAMLESPDKNISIKTREGNTETISLDDISYKSSYSADIQALKDSQSPYLWFAHGAGKNVYDVDINKSFDEETLKDKLSELDCVAGESVQDPVDAHLALAGDSFTIVEATEGNRIDTDKLDQTVIDGLKNGVFQVDLDEAGVYVTPTVYANDSGLKQSLEKIKSLESNVVTINLHDAEEKLDSKTFNSWLESDGNELTVNDEALNEYLDGLAGKYNTFGKEREFEATGLGKIKVGGGDWDTYGFKMDTESTAEAVKEAILAGKSDKVDVFWTVPANQRNGKNGDIGNTYVEIDISRQHMWYYIDGKLFTDTDVRTGTESSSQWTPTTEGVYRILWKQTDKWFLQVGDPCHSDYWMPFNDRGEGIHDATWYSTYGGNLYKWAGSHGCINTPYSIAQKIFNNISEGTPVIVYRS